MTSALKLTFRLLNRVSWNFLTLEGEISVLLIFFLIEKYKEQQPTGKKEEQ
jgi:hypothetical protein